MKKLILTVLVAFIFGRSFGQQAPYTFPLPDKWAKEQIKFPIDFAPGIPYKGTEELRFTPTWGKAEDNDYWSYVYLWSIDGSPKLNSDTLQRYMAQYFNGLYNANNKVKQADFTRAKIELIKAMGIDQQTYEGSISTLNFLTGKPLVLYTVIHVRNYPAANHSALLFELSPKPYDNIIWDDLNGVVAGFRINQ